MQGTTKLVKRREDVRKYAAEWRIEKTQRLKKELKQKTTEPRTPDQKSTPSVDVRGAHARRVRVLGSS